MRKQTPHDGSSPTDTTPAVDIHIAIISFGQFLFYAVCVDVIVYFIRAIFNKSFVHQFLDRYYLLFPSAGKRHYEKKYEKWLRKHHEEFDEYYYEDDEPYEDDDFYEEDESYEDDDYYEDDESYEDDDYYEDNESYEEDGYYEEEDSIEDKTAFNFFAGCSSRESVDKKYRSLVKLYHPDNMDGDTKALQEINVQYSEAKKRFG